MKNTRVAVIGAGPSGTAVLRAFQSAQEKGTEIPEIVCFEKQDDWGGLWNYTWRTGLDEYGEPVHCSMYRYLWSNGPKEGLEFADYTFDEHFGKPIASYPPREVLRHYIVGRLLKAGVRPWCRFRHPVRWVTYDERSGKFRVTVEDLRAKRIYTEPFDYVIVATGHFSTPNAPEFPGFDTFNGRILHAHDFRDALEFKDKDILVIGSSYSAEDIGSQCWKYGCRSVTSCYRTKPMGYKWPSNWEELPLLDHVEPNSNFCVFKDGTRKRIDAIILCTGYLHHFPFMEEGLRLRTANRLATTDLYKGVVWVNNPKLFYIGMQDQWFTFNMFDAQAWWVRDVILGRITVPQDPDVLTADWRRRQAEEEASTDPIGYQGDYVKELIAETDYPSFDVDGACQAFYEWKKHKKEDIMGYRDNSYRSVMTGKMSPKHHTRWVEAMDDSMEAYLRD